jgi:hypothetical protein
MSSADLFRYSPEAGNPVNESSNDDSEEISDDDVHNRGRASGSNSNQNKGYTEIKEQMYQVKMENWVTHDEIFFVNF